MRGDHAILTGRSYRKSAEMAGELGAFSEYETNRNEMLRVIRNHRRAAHGVSRDAKEWEALRIRPVPIDHGVFERGVNIANAPEILSHATRAWDEALELGVEHGYRNAQVTVIAPTGTIGLLMDCDTTGVEPDFALVKFKKLAGGGYFKIANNSLKPALVALGYDETEVREILTYVLGTLTLETPVPGDDEGRTLAAYLRDAGMKESDLKVVSDALPGVFELPFAFTPWALGDDAMVRLGIDAEEAKADHSFNLLERVGLTGEQIERLNETICGTQTVEGAPHLKEEHLPVFDCANTCGKIGERYIEAEGHIRMMAAAQPFISGAISKTINLPNEASVEDIMSAYRLSWELGLKANALYRDGSKLSQPLSNTSEEKKADEEDLLGESLADEDSEEDAAAREEIARETEEVAEAIASGDRTQAQRVVERIVHRPMRKRLPDTRSSLTHKFNIAGHEGYLTVGLYDDGQPGELFITMAKEGSTIGGVMDSLGTATSVALQYGVPIESLVKKFTHQRFEPAGMTTNPDIPFAKSLVDYIFRWLGNEFIDGYRDVNGPNRGGTKRSEERPSRIIERRVETPAGGDGESGGSGASAPKSRTHSADVSAATTPANALSVAMKDCQDDAPACEVCGTITVRNGTCYRCLNCGHSMGCS